MARTDKAPAPAAQAVTAHQPFSIGFSNLFAVQPGIPLANAFEELSLLVTTARDAAASLAMEVEGSSHGIEPCSVWPIAYLLDMANALQSSMDAGLKAAQGDAL